MFLFAVLVSVNNLHAQNSEHKKNHVSDIDTIIYYRHTLDVQASYAGGDSLLTKFFRDHFTFPDNFDVSGREYFKICFVVEKNGRSTIDQIPVPLRDRVKYNTKQWWQCLDTLMSDMKLLKPFNPAINKGKKVRSHHCMEIAICPQKKISAISEADYDHNKVTISDEGYYDPCPIPYDSIIITPVETNPKPEFPGGADSLEKFINDHLHPPKNAERSYSEKKVWIQFVVELDGSISSVLPSNQRIQRLEEEGLITIPEMEKKFNEEAVNVVRMMPKWNPGKQFDRPRRVLMSIPIHFKIKH